MEISPLHAALAGLTAHSVKLAVHANNIANINTYSYMRKRAAIESDESGSPAAVISSTTDKGPCIQVPDGLPEAERYKEMSNVDLPKELLHMKMAEYGYRASASIIPAYDEMVGTILDIIT
jgi:flagellar hook protein FlgE